MKYRLKMKNPVSGKLECYDSGDMTEQELKLGLDFWESAGYTVVSVEEIP